MVCSLVYKSCLISFVIGLRFIRLIVSLRYFFLTLLNLIVSVPFSPLRRGEHRWLLLEKDRRRVISHHRGGLFMELIHFLSVHVTTILALQSASASRTVIGPRTICLPRTCLVRGTRTQLGFDRLGRHIDHIVALRASVLAAFRQLELVKRDFFLALDI